MDAWDKGVMEEKFPDEIDEDGDGLIFYLMPAGWDGDYNKRAVKDGAFYAKWRKECLGDEEEIQPLYRALTREKYRGSGVRGAIKGERTGSGVLPGSGPLLLMRAVSQAPVPGWGVKLPPPVDLRAHEQDTDTEIQPQHHQDHCRQASVGHSENF